MTIRKVNISDTQAITDIYNHYVENTTVSFETEPLTYDEMKARIVSISSNYPYYVCIIDGKIAAYCCVHLWRERAAYCHTVETTIYVAPGFERQGLGTTMMTLLIDECRKRDDITALVACITAENEASCSLHRKLGFKRVSLFEKVGLKFGRWLDVADYELVL